MGWSLPLGLRKELVQKADALVLENDFSPQFVIVDLNTQIRFVTAGPPVSPLVAANRVIDKSLPKGNSQGATVIMLADNKHKMNPVRHKVQVQRLKLLTPEQCEAAVNRGLIVVGNRAFAFGKEPYDAGKLKEIEEGGIRQVVVWERLLASSKGKGIAFNLIESAIKHAAQSTIRGSAFKLLLWYLGEEPYTFPNNWPKELVCAIVDNDFGEADERVTEAIAALQSFHASESIDILVKTIDTDMLLQMLVAPIKSTGKIRIQFKNEVVDALKWRDFYGATLNERASRALLLMLASGCDYNKGITQYGYLNKAIVAKASETPIKSPFVLIDRESESCSVDVPALAKIVRSIPRRNKRKIPEEFEEELLNASFTVAYFSNIKRHQGGPRHQMTQGIFGKPDSGESEFDAFVTLNGSQKLQIVF